jgi:hypothetical protein
VSYRDGISLGLDAYDIAQHVGCGDVDRLAREIAGFTPEAGEITQRASWLKIDEEVNVAVRPGLAAGGGAEQTHISCAMSASDLQKLPPVSTNERPIQRRQFLTDLCGKNQPGAAGREQPLERGHGGNGDTSLIASDGRL